MLYPTIITSVKQLHEIGQFSLLYQMLLHFVNFGVNITLSAPSQRRSFYTVNM